MIINGTSTPGIVMYTPGLELERGDFVVYGDCIYICTPLGSDTYIISETTPTPDVNNENFISYLGGDAATWEDFEKQFSQSVTSNDLTDKIITSSCLSQILKRLMFGIDSSGIINEHLNYSSKGINTISPGLKRLINLDNMSNLGNVLNYLLTNEVSPEFNNLSIRVNRSFFKGLLPDITNLSKDVYDEVETSSVVLRQYTYYETLQELGSAENKIRVQEVIDHINGVCLYRFVRFGKSNITTNSEDNIGLPSSWKLSCVNLDYLSKLDSLLKYIEEEKAKIEESKSKNTKDKFYFRKLSLSEKTIKDNEIIYVVGANESVSDSEMKEVTVTVLSTKKNSELKNSYSMTVNLEVAQQGTIYAYPNDIKLVRANVGIVPTIKLILPESISSADIHSIYVKTI